MFQSKKNFLSNKGKGPSFFFSLLIFLMGFFSYGADLLAFNLKISNTVLINSLALTALYFYNKKTGVVLFLLGAFSCFLFSAVYYPLSIFNFSTLLFCSIHLGFFTIIFKKIMETWSFEKSLKYFIYSTIFLVFFYFLFLSLILFALVIVKSGFLHLLEKNQTSPLFKKMIFSLFQKIIENQLGENPLSTIGQISFAGVFLNIKMFMTAYFGSMFIFIINLKNGVLNSFEWKLKSGKIPIPQSYKHIFFAILSLTTWSFYFKYKLVFFLIPLLVSLLFLFFIVGREIILNILYSISSNFFIVNLIFFILQSFLPFLFFVIIAIGMVEVYCKLWTDEES